MKMAEPAEVPDKWEYYYRDSDCPAADSGDPDCVCWHDEGRGPYNNARHHDEDTFLEWRRVNAPTQAEVPIPEPDTHCYDEDERRDVWSYSRDLLLHHGDAREAAGYARGYRDGQLAAQAGYRPINPWETGGPG